MSKEKKVKEENVKQKKHSNITYILIILILIGIIIAGSIIFVFDKDGEKKSEPKPQVELQHTLPTTVKTEGVYITDVSDVVDEVMPAIVSITSKTIISSGRYGPMFYGSREYTAEGAGSGVIVAENDKEIFILTNYHVVEDTNELSVKFINDESYDAKVKGISERKDIAIVSVSKKDVSEETLKSIKLATLGSSDELKVGNGIIAIGNALGYGQSVTTGVVSALNREVETEESTQEMIQIDAAINGGNSGGALLNSRGEVVGINTAKYSSNLYSTSSSIEGMGFAIPISDIESVIENLINGEDDKELLLGIEGYMTNSSVMYDYGLPVGFYVTKIAEDGNAKDSELEIGNIITEAGGIKVTTSDSIKKALNKKKLGDTIKLKVKYASRNEYKEKEIEIKLNK